MLVTQNFKHSQQHRKNQISSNELAFTYKSIDSLQKQFAQILLSEFIELQSNVDHFPLIINDNASSFSGMETRIVNSESRPLEQDSVVEDHSTLTSIKATTNVSSHLLDSQPLKAAVIRNPLLLYLHYFYDRDTNSFQLPNSDRCFDLSEGLVSFSGFHSYLKPDHLLECSSQANGSYQPVFDFRIDIEADPNRSYPNFSSMMGQPKTKVLVVTVAGDTFGESNFLNLSEYLYETKEHGPHVGSKRSGARDLWGRAIEGSFVLKKDESFGPRHPEGFIRLRTVELQKANPKRTLEITFLYVGSFSGTSNAYRIFGQQSDVVIQHSHSGYGENLTSILESVSREDRYQLFFLGACRSLSLGSSSIGLGKKILSSDSERLLWDLIGSQQATPIWNSEDYLKIFLHYIAASWLTFNDGGDLSEFNIGSLLLKLNESDHQRSDWSYLGSSAQRNQPLAQINEPLDEAKIHHKIVESLLLFMEFSDLANDEVLQRFKRRPFVTPERLERALEEVRKVSNNPTRLEIFLRKLHEL